MAKTITSFQSINVKYDIARIIFPYQKFTFSYIIFKLSLNLKDNFQNSKVIFDSFFFCYKKQEENGK